MSEIDPLPFFKHSRAHSNRNARAYSPMLTPNVVGQPIRDAVNGSRKDLTADDIRYGRMLVQQQLDIVGMMNRVGVRLMAGTDLPLDHPRLHDELALLVQAGLTPLQALQSATRNPAAFLGVLDSLGTVEQGKIADLVLLDADPLATIDNAKKIHAVIVAGRFVETPSVQDTTQKSK
jgi:imidazolonepropionase-like amidohydrolase